jgi:hypothetical protein
VVEADAYGLGAATLAAEAGIIGYENPHRPRPPLWARLRGHPPDRKAYGMKVIVLGGGVI